jgi:hypothetical protein
VLASVYGEFMLPFDEEQQSLNKSPLDEATLLKRAGQVADGRIRPGSRKQRAKSRSKARVAEANTVNAVLDDFLREYVRGPDSLRSADQVERAFNVYVRPRIGTKSIYDVQRSDIKTMLAEIANDHGACHGRSGASLLSKGV